MTILEQEANKRKDKEKKNELLKCPKCGEQLINNTFMHGGRTGGKMFCNCGYWIIF